MNRHAKAAALAFVLVAVSLPVPAQVGPCTLATPADLEAALGRKVALTPVKVGNVDACSGKSGETSVTIRHFRRTDDAAGKKEEKGLEVVKRMGATVEVKKFGPISCVAVSPGGQLAGQPHTTSCSVAKPPMYAVVEVSGKQAMPIDRLRPLAEKMATRF